MLRIAVLLYLGACANICSVVACFCDVFPRDGTCSGIYSIAVVESVEELARGWLKIVEWIA